MLLVWLNHSPFNDKQGQEMTDLLLTYAAYEQPVMLLFSGLAIYSLLPAVTTSGKMPIKAYHRQFKALPMYDVERVYVCAESLRNYGMQPAQLPTWVTVVEHSRIADLVEEAQYVLRNG